MQFRHITPAEIESLAPDGMAAMGHLPNKDRAAAPQGPGPLQGNRERTGLIKEHLRLEILRQGGREGIKKGHGGQLLQLPQPRQRGTPDQLEGIAAEGQDREGPLRAKQLPGLIGIRAPQPDLNRQTALPVRQTPVGNPTALPGGGAMPIGGHAKINGVLRPIGS